MLTIFSTPKPFTGLSAIHQINAIHSWQQLCPPPEILIFGDDQGTAEACADLGVRHIPGIATTERGTPLLNAMFEQAALLGSGEVFLFVNADIILPGNLPDIVRTVRSQFDSFLVVGQRRDVDFDTQLPSNDRTAFETIVRDASQQGEVKGPVWIDYFCFTPGVFGSIPTFAVGRPGYDNWLLWRAAQRGIPVIDATECLTVVHQRHDYGHGGGKKAVWEGSEARSNTDLIGNWRHYHSIWHATFALDSVGHAIPATAPKYRLAPIRTRVSHWLRFTRPLRRRLQGERATWRRP